MSIAKPFTFVANTYAKASEVNADFDTVYSQVNTNISNIAQNATDIDNLENNKADVNGNASQRFAVADSVTSSDAINKGYLMNAIGNSIDIISGLIITRDSGSPDDTIIVSEGSCYDSTHAVVLSLNNSLSKQNLNQGANSTYYVYIIGNSSASQTDILISTEQTTPALPTGYSLFRQIGKYTTDGNGKILAISSLTDYKNDGQWVENSVLLSDTKTAGTYEIDLSNYLPSDNYSYELMLNCLLDADGDYCHQACGSSVISETIVNVVASYADQSRNVIIFPVGWNKQLNYTIYGSPDICEIRLVAYRRIGTNG